MSNTNSDTRLGQQH